MVPDFDLYDGIFFRKNYGIAEGYVPYEARNALGKLALHASGHFNVERPRQHHHVLKTVIGQIRHGTNAEREFRGGFQRPIRRESDSVFHEKC